MGGCVVCTCTCSVISLYSGFAHHCSPPQQNTPTKPFNLPPIHTQQDVDHNVVPHFRAAAQQLLAHADGDAELALALTIAHATGHASIKARSLLSSMEDWVTMHYTTKWDVAKPGYVYHWLKKKLPEEDVELIKRVQITADGKGAVFDVPADKAQSFLEACAGDGEDASARLVVPSQLPALKEREGESGGGMQGGGQYGRGWGGRGGRGAQGGGFGGRGGGRGGFGGGQGGRGRGGWQRR